MDKTKEYIKQCDCPEIQEGHIMEDGDFFHQQSGGFTECVTIEQTANDYGTMVESSGERATWLPRQDQLQEMVSDKYSLMEYCTFFWEALADGRLSGDSMEQLWLAFVMHELYQKRWVKGEWVNV